ncbi:hypothetical protein EJ08DRAFT_181484 [Tothia fuscella]|uniref:Uncharacterized protein n=1 Tax=Tothia fuscella TaxID=1048955 RepID=A0A9P4TYM7_9PEZI|nr:hypothetical protein EJ08DRAFT_181484 [Tothia fuscella]
MGYQDAQCDPVFKTLQTSCNRFRACSTRMANCRLSNRPLFLRVTIQQQTFDILTTECLSYFFRLFFSRFMGNDKDSLAGITCMRLAQILTVASLDQLRKYQPLPILSVTEVQLDKRNTPQHQQRALTTFTYDSESGTTCPSVRRFSPFLCIA